MMFMGSPIHAVVAKHSMIEEPSLCKCAYQHKMQTESQMIMLPRGNHEYKGLYGHR